MTTERRTAPAEVARWVLREQRPALLGWALALAAIAAMYLAFWPTMGDNPEMQALVDGLPEAIVVGMGWDRIATAAGYLESTIYGLLGPALLLVFAVATGARVLAGEEESGTLELELSGPTTRRRVLLERFAALALGALGLSAVVGVTTVALVLGLEMDVGLPEVVAATFGLWLFVLAMGAVAFAAGAATGRRGIAVAVGAGAAVAAYLADALAPVVGDGAWLHRLSPFSWYLHGDPLVQGLDLGGSAALVALTVVAVGVGLVRFERRDLGV